MKPLKTLVRTVDLETLHKIEVHNDGKGNEIRKDITEAVQGENRETIKKKEENNEQPLPRA